MTTISQPTDKVERVDEQHRRELVAGLRELADFLEQHPDVPAPYRAHAQISVFGEADDEVFADARRIAGLVGATVNEDMMRLRAERTFGGYVDLVVHAQSTTSRQLWQTAMTAHQAMEATARNGQTVLAALTPDDPALPTEPEPEPLLYGSAQAEAMAWPIRDALVERGITSLAVYSHIDDKVNPSVTVKTTDGVELLRYSCRDNTWMSPLGAALISADTVPDAVIDRALEMARWVR